MIYCAAVLLCTVAHGQASRHQLRQAGRDYNKQRYEEAETKYRRALLHDSTDFKGQYNLGNTLYRQEKYAEAAAHFQQALAAPDIDKKQRARAFHNQGNSLLKAAMQDEQHQGLQQAVNSYQEALKLDPKNDDTRYNLAYARRLLQQQQQGGQGQQQSQQGQQNQQNQQQGQQNQQQEQQQDQQNQQQGQSQPRDGDDNRQDRRNQPQPQQQDRQRQDAERLLEAVKNNERQTLRDKQKAAQHVRVQKTDKDW